MLLDVLAVGSLVALAAFIVWEGWQRRRDTIRPLPRDAMERGFVPGASATEQIAWVGAAVLAVVAGALFVSPPHPPFTGRGAALSTLIHGVFGPFGIPSAIGAGAVACLSFGLSRRRTRLGAQRVRRTGA